MPVLLAVLREMRNDMAAKMQERGLERKASKEFRICEAPSNIVSYFVPPFRAASKRKKALS